ncbi:GSU2403 family nucleotidyltransferase fold protein (plasmid) [Sinorhizobium chiapasense]|uniref:GSU2403 family nucleotidyltransferase fold protein n=1 Tax=Sinorhizobium chiapasense TaxID=501572 RepID=UPI002FDF8531
MVEIVTLYTDEQRRVLINIQQHYDVWLGVERALITLPYGMKWAERSGKQYLYELLDRTGNAKSLGARSEKTEAAYERFLRTKEDLEGRLLESRKRLAETCALYRSLLLPQIPSEAAKILREADKRRMLGDKLLVVGTNAMPAYNIEAGGRINDAPDETDDFDMTWSALIKDETRDGVMSMLKAADSTYTVNTERTFQARNAKAFEFELLAAPSTVCNMLQNDKPSPLPLPEQEWLLLGRHVNRVVVGRDGTPARLVVPDPRYFALQKLWMADQDKRDDRVHVGGVAGG